MSILSFFKQPQICTENVGMHEVQGLEPNIPSLILDNRYCCNRSRREEKSLTKNIKLRKFSIQISVGNF
jgi:hypothetical protein